MSTFECKLCLRKFTSKRNLTNHENKQVCLKKGSKCLYCKEEFSNKHQKAEHIKKFHFVEHNLTKQIDKLNKQIDSKTKCIKIENTINNNCNNKYYQNTNCNVNYINNIIINKFGEEDYSKLTFKEKYNILKKGFYAPLSLTEKIHFNRNIPENHNIQIGNLKDKYGKIFNGERWITIDKKKLLEDLMLNKTNYLQELLEDDKYGGKLSKTNKESLERVTTINEDTCSLELKRAYKELLKDMLLLIYNNRDLTEPKI